MAVAVVHTKVSTIPDSQDTSLIRPSDWNASHTLNGVTAKGLELLEAADAAGVRTAAGLETILRSYIRGLCVTRSTTTAISVSAGEYWDDTQGLIVSYAGGTSSPALVANTMYSVFLANGVVEVFAENPPSAIYAGTARKRATGNGGRFIGCFRTNGSSQIYNQYCDETAHGGAVVTYSDASQDGGTGPFRVLSAGSAVAYTAVSLLNIAPRYATTEVQIVLFAGYTGAGAASVTVNVSRDNVGLHGSIDSYIASAGSAFPRTTLGCPVDASVPQIQYRVNAATHRAYIDVVGYRFTR